jgi:dolichyl-phosphate beta-glucosyltransferase
MSFTRKLSGRIFHFILNMLDLADVRDTQCGFKLFKSHLAKKLTQNQKCFGFSFDIEYLFLAKRYGSKIKEVPINWHHVEGSKVNIFKDSIKMLLEVLKIRFI